MACRYLYVFNPLRTDDIVVANGTYGRARRLQETVGVAMKQNGLPGEVVRMIGQWPSGLPKAGDPFMVVDSLNTAKRVVKVRKEKKQWEEMKMQSEAFFNAQHQKIKGETVNTHKLVIVVKADTQGTAEALVECLNKLTETDRSLGIEAQCSVVHYGTGSVTVEDIRIAQLQRGIVVSFNTPIANTFALKEAKSTQTDIVEDTLLHNLLLTVQTKLKQFLEKHTIGSYSGSATVKKSFELTNGITVAGCVVTEGSIASNSTARVFRDETLLFTGQIESIKHQKEDRSVVKTDEECGISMPPFTDFREGDVIKVYTAVTAIQ